MTLAQHIVIRPADGRPLFNDLDTRRLFTEKVAHVGEPFSVGAWGAGDNHGHVANLDEDRAAATEMARRLESSLTQQLGLTSGFAPVSVKPIADQSHLYSSLPYIMRQGERHGVRCDPFHEGSSLPDLIGFRHVFPGLRERLARLAPRLDPRRFVPELGAEPARDDASAWAAASAAVFGCGELVGRRPSVMAARRAAVELATEASVASLCEALHCSPRQLRRIRKMPAPPRAVLDAVIAQSRWRNAAGRARLIPGDAA